MIRRLPVYILLDCSGSMTGEPIEGVRKGVNLLHDALLSDPVAMDTAYLSVITFATEASITPLTSLFDFQPPKIEANGWTAMGAALNLLAESVEKDVRRKRNEDERGDYRPLVFLFTDGHPTDNEVFPDAVKRVKGMRWGQFVACAGGAHADVNKLLEITDGITDGVKDKGAVLMIDELSEEKLKSYFEWVSGSIVSSMTPNGQQPPLPGGVNLVKPPRKP